MKYLFLEEAKYYKGILGADWLDKNKELIEFSGARHYKKNICFFKKYTAVISIQYLWPLCNLVIFKANSAGVKTILFTDGIIEWENCHKNPYVLKSGLSLYSPVIHQVFACPGKFESSFFHKNSIAFTPQKITPKKVHHRMSGNDIKTILLTTANTPYFSEEERCRLKTIIREITIKCPHKLVLRVFDSTLIDFEEAKLLRNETSIPFEDVLNEVDAVISTPSSVILTSMLSGKPTGQIIYRDAPIFLQSGWMIHQSCDITQTLNSMASAEKERMSYQEKIISYNYPSEEIEAVLAGAPDTSHEKIKFVYNNTLLRIVESPFNINFEMLARRVFHTFKRIFNR